MEIKISTLTLHNFKGVREATFIFSGGNARIEGENGTGKSTVFDAFTWLLFGKDHRGLDWTNFDLKPIDPETHEAIHGLEHSVEADLLIDGVKTTLRRVVTEDWVKPRGVAERVLKGHKQSFFINGVDTATKKAYDAAIAQWIDEGVFKLLTNPHYFIDDAYTDWKSRRKGILSLLDDSGKEELRERFADLVAEMAGEPMEQFRKRVAAEKKAQKERLAEATANIAAWYKALPEEVDTKSVRDQIAGIEKDRDQRIAGIRAMIAGIDAGLEDINKANADLNAKVGDLHKQVTDIRLRQEAYINERLDKVREAVDAHRKDRQKALDDADAVMAEISHADSQIKAARSEAKTQQSFRNHDAEELRELGVRYNEARERVFSYDGTGVCPACGQPLPKDRVDADAEAARRKFLERQRAEIQDIVAKAKELKAAIAGEDALIQAKEDLARGLKIKRDELAARWDALMHTAKDLKAAPVPDPDEVEKGIRREIGFLALVKEEHDVNAKILECNAGSISPADLLSDRRTFESQVQDAYDEAVRQTRALRDLLAAADQRQRLLDMISGEEERQRTFADEVARLERLECRTLEYIKAEIDSQESAINALFKVCRWKMFSYTLDGGITEMCEVMSPDGVPYRSMNDAMRILCGLDVIRVFSGFYGVTAPIFIDNAESITRSSFDTPAQVIRLVVREGSELTTINE